VQGLAALAVHDRTHPLADDVRAMTAAAAGCRSARVAGARGGQLTGSADGEVLATGTDLGAVVVGVLTSMVTAEDELVTLLAGDAVGDAAFRALTERVQAGFPRVEIEAHRGDQSDDLVLIGVE
jgi:dihydroxyacetone kinase-like predicted kinase